MLSLPDEGEGEEQNDQTDGANSVENVRNTDGIDPWDHGENEDGREHVSHKRQTDESITDNLQDRLAMIKENGWVETHFVVRIGDVGKGNTLKWSRSKVA